MFLYTGYVFTLGNAAISWCSRKQRCVTLSSTEAEYVALTEGAKEAVHLKDIIAELTGADEPVVLHNDSQSAQKLASNTVFHNRTMHVNIRYHFIREKLKEGKFVLKYIPTETMIADSLTKPVPPEKLKLCVSGMGMSQV